MDSTHHSSTKDVHKKLLDDLEVERKNSAQLESRPKLKRHKSFSNFRELVKKQSYHRISPEKEDYSNWDNIKGAMFMTLSAFVYAFLLMYQKFLFTHYPDLSFGQQNIFRGLMMILFNSFMVIKNKERFTYDKDTNVILAKRVVFGFIAEYLLFLSTDYLRINTSSTFYLLYAVICSLVSGIVLNEVVTKQDIMIIISVFLSACLIVKPFFGSGEDTFEGICMGMCSSLGFCMMVIYHKFLNGVSTFTINFYFGLCYFTEGILSFSFGDTPFDSRFMALSHLFILSIVYTFSCYIFIVAINSGKVSFVLPFENTNIVFSLILGHFVLGEICDNLDIIGTTLILGLCVFRSVVLINEEGVEELAQNEDDTYKLMN